MEIFKNLYLTIEYDVKHSLMAIIWNDVTASMSNKEGKKLLAVILEKEQHYKPARIIGNHCKPGFDFEPTLQDWLEENVASPTPCQKRRKKKDFLIG